MFLPMPPILDVADLMRAWNTPKVKRQHANEYESPCQKTLTMTKPHMNRIPMITPIITRVTMNLQIPVPYNQMNMTLRHPRLHNK